jgi:hypothetical protein
MAFVTSIGVTQSSDCSQFVINDTSTYTVEGTGTFSSRKLTIQKSDGTFLTVGSVTYNQYTWPFAAGNSITITSLLQDYAYNITLTLTSNAPQTGSIYTKAELIVLVCYTISAFYANTYKMAANQGLEKDYKFVKDLMRLFIEQESAKKAGIDGDIGSAQACLDRGKFVSDNLKIGY